MWRSSQFYTVPEPIQVRSAGIGQYGRKEKESDWGALTDQSSWRHIESRVWRNSVLVSGVHYGSFDFDVGTIEPSSLHALSIDVCVRTIDPQD
jgi:hypothetical protein